MSDKTVNLLVSFKVPGQSDVEITKQGFLNMLKRQILKFTKEYEISDATADACIKALLQTPESKETQFSIVCDNSPEFPIVPVILTKEDEENFEEGDERKAGDLEYEVSNELPGMRSECIHVAHFDEAISTSVEAQKRKSAGKSGLM